MKQTESARRNSKSNSSLTDDFKSHGVGRIRKSAVFVVCVNNTGYAASLEARKIYRLLADGRAGAHGMLRVVDESGEGYLYPAACFVPIELPKSVQAALAKAG